MAALIESIHSTSRRKIWSNIFQKRTQLVSLDFLGLRNHMVSDFGMVFKRGRMFINRRKKCIGYNLPSAILDADFPYPWVVLPFAGGPQWFPVNQLLGWAFAPTENREERYFVADVPQIITPLLLSSFKWETTIKRVKNSYYCRFMDTIYS